MYCTLKYYIHFVFYALAKEAEGFKVRDVSWIMLKYCEVKFMGKKRSNSKNKTEIVKVLNRGKLIYAWTHVLRKLHKLLQKNVSSTSLPFPLIRVN
mgnify:CR=1 FL=1